MPSGKPSKSYVHRKSTNKYDHRAMPSQQEMTREEHQTRRQNQRRYSDERNDTSAKPTSYRQEQYMPSDRKSQYDDISHSQYHSHTPRVSNRGQQPRGRPEHSPAKKVMPTRDQVERRQYDDHDRRGHHRAQPISTTPHAFVPAYRRGEMTPLSRHGVYGHGGEFSDVDNQRKYGRHKIKRQRSGCCGCFNSCFCGGGCCDNPEVLNGRPGGFKKGGPLKGLNCKGCCDRERVYIRRGSSVHSWHMLNLDDNDNTVNRHLIDDQMKKRRGCC